MQPLSIFENIKGEVKNEQTQTDDNYWNKT